MQDTNETSVDAQAEIAAENTATEAAIEAAAETVEAAPEAEVAPEIKAAEEKFAAKFAALSRKEKALKQREAQITQQMAQIEARLKEFEGKDAELSTYKSLPDRIKRNPFEVLKEQGVTEQQLLEMLANDGKPTQEMIMSEYEKKVMSKVEELEKKLADKEAKENEQKYEAALQQFQGQLTDFVNKTEDYELIRANDAVDVVFQVIEEHHKETGNILSNKEACDAVENYLLEEAKKLVDRDKVKKLLQPEAKKAVPAQGKSQTLSNAQAAQASKPSGRKLSDDESKAEAAKLLRWND